MLAAAPDRFNEIISCTTRPPREGEIDGVNYYFLEKDDFIQKVLLDQMLEHTVFNGWCYGTSNDTLSHNKLNIGVFNPAGIYSLLKRQDIELTVYRIVCGSKTRLLRQLNREENPNVDEIIRRYGTDSIDFNRLDFDYIEMPNEVSGDLTCAVMRLVGELD